MDRIHGMLERASAWSRRGWLVMLRARRSAADDGGESPVSDDGWRWAVEWLLRSPAHSALFREIVAFL